MKSNAEELELLPAFARKNGVRDVKVSNLIANTREMQSEVMYERTLALELHCDAHQDRVNIDLPLFDMTKDISLASVFNSHANVSVMGTPVSRRKNYCKFVQEGNVFVRADGEVCPCMALLHTATTVLHDEERTVRFASYGNVSKSGLQEIWQSPEYRDFRERVIKFEFSPCHVCGACDMVEDNEQDCYHNPFPTCGACLWAQDLVQCP